MTPIKKCALSVVPAAVKKLPFIDLYIYIYSLAYFGNELNLESISSLGNRNVELANETWKLLTL